MIIILRLLAWILLIVFFLFLLSGASPNMDFNKPYVLPVWLLFTSIPLVLSIICFAGVGTLKRKRFKEDLLQAEIMRHKLLAENQHKLYNSMGGNANQDKTANARF